MIFIFFAVGNAIENRKKKHCCGYQIIETFISRRKKLIITIIIASCDDTFSSNLIKFERTYWLFFLFCFFCFSVCLTPQCLKTEVSVREYFHNRLKWCGRLYILTIDSFNANLIFPNKSGKLVSSMALYLLSLNDSDKVDLILN